MSDAGDDTSDDASLRPAVVRAVVVAPLMALAVPGAMACGALGPEHLVPAPQVLEATGPAAVAAFGATLGLASGAAAWAEARATRACGGARRGAPLAALGALALVAAGALLAVFQLFYVQGAAAGRPLEGMSEGAGAALLLAASPAFALRELLLPLAAPAAVTALLRPFPLGAAAAMVASAPLVALAAARVAHGEWQLVPGELMVAYYGVACLALLVAPAAWVADWLERRLWPAAQP